MTNWHILWTSLIREAEKLEITILVELMNKNQATFDNHHKIVSYNSHYYQKYCVLCQIQK